MSQIAQNLEEVRRRMAAAAQRAGRDPAQVRLVAVSKTVPVERLQEAVAAGQRLFGENYLQEARGKIEALGEAAAGILSAICKATRPRPRWIGSS